MKSGLGVALAGDDRFLLTLCLKYKQIWIGWSLGNGCSVFIAFVIKKQENLDRVGPGLEMLGFY